MIDAVVLDIGNVLIAWDPHGFYDRRIGRERRERLFEAVPLLDMNAEVDLGAPFQRTVEKTAEAHPDWREEILLWRDHWLEMTAPDFPLSVSLLRAMRSKGIPVWALSNFGIETLAMADGEYPFLREFDRRIISGEVGVIKPDPEIYACVEAQGTAPDRLLFVDDVAANVEAAAARGWQTHLFEGPEGLARRLVDEGLLSEAEAA